MGTSFASDVLVGLGDVLLVGRLPEISFRRRTAV